MIEGWGVDNTLFVTLTFGGGKEGPTIKQAETAWNSFLSNGLSERFPGGAKIVERGDKNGRVHMHLLVNAGEDVSKGTDFDALKRGDYRSVNPACRRAYGWLRANAQKYGFGRIVNCQPIKSTAEGAARYVSKYISKHFGKRRPEDKGARLRSYFGCARAESRCTCRFSWAGEHGERGWLWRRKLAQFAGRLGFRADDGRFETWARENFGPRWAWHLGPRIMDETLTFYPTKRHAIADGRWLPNDVEGTDFDFTLCPAWGTTELYTIEDPGTWRIRPPGPTFRDRVEAAGRRWSEREAARGVDRTICWKGGGSVRVEEPF
jgi:hypothetical protein